MEISKDLRNRLLTFYANDPFVQFLKFAIVDFQRGQAILKVEASNQYSNALQILHGGLLMTLADTAMGAACMTLNKKVVTLDINFNFMKAFVLHSTVKARAHVLHNGSRTMVTEAELLNETGQICLKARGTFFVIEKFTL